MKKILIIKLGSTFQSLIETQGDFEDWFKKNLTYMKNKTETVIPGIGEKLSIPGNYSGIILTGSHSMVTDKEDWSEKTSI